MTHEGALPTLVRYPAGFAGGSRDLMQKTTGTTEPQTSPILVKLGKASRKRLKKLKGGEGPLMAEVLEAVEQVRAGVGAKGEGKLLLPIVIIYSEKKKGGRLGLPLAR